TDNLNAAGFGGKFEIAGMSLLSAVEVPQMIKDLQLGFYAALGLVMLVLMVATGSIALGLLSLIPNLIPILGVETWLYISGQQLTMTAAVALTIAFGIAVDDTIHFLNSYQQARARDPSTSIAIAIREVVSPITTSTLLLVGGLIVTQISALPSVAIFGQLVAASLVLALFASIFLLPAFVEPFNRAKNLK
ncbi:MAG: MMPL family transporter, partial [Rhizobiales bacterium]|nr:MMPL family transporter [Hyphomicrobiales bacterium]